MGLRIYSEYSTKVAIAYFDSTKGIWISEGWWKISNNATVTVLNGKLTQRYYYIFINFHVISHAGIAGERYEAQGNPTRYFRIESSDSNFCIGDASKIGFFQSSGCFIEIDIGSYKRDDFTYNINWKYERWAATLD